MGYYDASVLDAPRKENDSLRIYSEDVANYLRGRFTFEFNITEFLSLLESSVGYFIIIILEPQEYGVREPSIFALQLPDFDIVYGFPIEFFHKMSIVCELIIFSPFFFDSTNDSKDFKRKLNCIAHFLGFSFHFLEETRIQEVQAGGTNSEVGHDQDKSKNHARPNQKHCSHLRHEKIQRSFLSILER